jgi:hypothetical protein
VGSKDTISVEREGSDNRKEWWHGCWRSDRLDSVGWAAIFIWAALVLLAESTNFKTNFGWWDGWGVFLTGAGVIVLLETVIRLLMPEFRASWWWTLICGLVLLSIGLGSWDGWGWIWAFVLAAVGVAILRSVFVRDRSSRNSDRDGESWCGV